MTNKLNNNHYSVYVVELSPTVMNERKFRDKNKQYLNGSKCMYVGMTGIGAKERYEKHKAGIKHNVYVQKYGKHLVPELTTNYTNLSYEEACAIEIKLASELRQKGMGVWSA